MFRLGRQKIKVREIMVSLCVFIKIKWLKEAKPDLYMITGIKNIIDKKPRNNS